MHIPPYWFVDYFSNKVVDNILGRDSDSWMRKVALAHFGIQSLTIAHLTDVTDVKVAQEVREH